MRTSHYASCVRTKPLHAFWFDDWKAAKYAVSVNMSHYHNVVLNFRSPLIKAIYSFFGGLLMKNRVLLLTILSSLIFTTVQATETEDLHHAQTLEKHFQNTEEFTAWYKTLSPTDKNQVLAGTAALCRPDLLNIALQNGGDIKTYVMGAYITAGHDDDSILLIYSHPTKDEKEEFKIFEQGLKESEKHMKEEACGHTFSLFGAATPGLVPLAISTVKMCNNYDKTIEILNLLNQHQIDISEAKEQLLLREIPKNNLTAVEYLLNQGTPINSFQDLIDKIEHIHTAGPSSEDNMEVQKQMLDFIFSHIGINYQDKNGETALFYAVHKHIREKIIIKDEQINLVKYLLEKGIDVNILNNKGENAFDNCAYPLCRLHPEGLKRFTINHPEVEEALYYAQTKNDYLIVKAYINKGYDIRSISNSYLRDYWLKYIKHNDFYTYHEKYSKPQTSTDNTNKADKVNNSKKTRNNKKIHIPKPDPAQLNHTGESVP